MKFDLNENIKILSRTPVILENILKGLDNKLICSNEGKGTWSPKDITAHLIQGEREDWIERAEIILSGGGDKRFKPFIRTAHNDISKNKTIDQLLSEFKSLRKRNITILKSKNISRSDLSKTGIHPEFGIVTLRQLITTWVIHDLDHISQICRVLAFQMKEDAGPWKAYLRIIQ